LHQAWLGSIAQLDADSGTIGPHSRKTSELGGLDQSMPSTAGFCIVGSASISACPLFGSFVSKSPILAATAEQGHLVAWPILMFASAGVPDHSGIQIPAPLYALLPYPVTFQP
jgi:NADH:ubiquinone oxidoreductase subunit 2 (subunit N)